MKQIILIALLVAIGMSVVFAQGGHKGRKHHHPKLNEEAKAALQKFQKEEIYPVKKAAHDQFLANLNEKDKAFLDQKRVEGKAIHQQMHSLRKEMKGLRESGKSREEMHEMRKEKFAPLREQQKAFMESMKAFMEGNEALIKTSMEPIKENREVWKTKKKAIIDQHLSEEEKAEMETRKEERGERGRHKDGRHAHKGEKGDQAHEGRREKGAVQFVLWDGTMRTPRENQSADSKNSTTTIEQLSKSNPFTVSTYPNPAISQTTILLNLSEEAKNVKISLTNAEGQKVWSKSYNKLTVGEHQVDVNLQKLVSGQYFYTVEIGEERITKPFVVNK